MMAYFWFVGKVSRLFIKVFLHFVQNLNLILKAKYSIRVNFNISNLPVQFFFLSCFLSFFLTNLYNDDSTKCNSIHKEWQIL